MARHILPNVMHLVLITTVLDFSGLILYEAVLSYVGVGVDPSTWRILTSTRAPAPQRAAARDVDLAEEEEEEQED